MLNGPGGAIMNDDKASGGGKPFCHDLMAEGVISTQRTTLALGRRGSGKTLFALQSLLSGVRRGEPGIFVTFDQSPEQVIQQAAFFGWDIPALQEQNLLRLACHTAEEVVHNGRVEVDRLLDPLRILATKIKARNIVFDSFQILLKVLKNRAQEVEETFRLREWLFERELTGIVTADVVEDLSSKVPRYAFLQFMADCVVALDFQFAGDRFERALRVVKYRGTIASGPEVSFRITKSGLELSLTPDSTLSPGKASAANQEIERARQILSSRLARLDGYLEVKQAELDYLLEKANPDFEAEDNAGSTPRADPRW
jgi:circadian clock protein KaiC